MGRGIFGWSYPPGAANDPNAPYNQVDGICEMCGNFEDDCICPECPECGGCGDPNCYGGDLPHLKVTKDQIKGIIDLIEKDEKWMEDEDRLVAEQLKEWSNKE